MKRLVYHLLALCLTCCIGIPSTAARALPVLKTGPAFTGRDQAVIFGLEPDRGTHQVRRYVAYIDFSREPFKVEIHPLADPLWDPVFTAAAGLMALRFHQDQVVAPKGSADLIGLTVEVGEQMGFRLAENTGSVIYTRFAPVTVAVGGPAGSLVLSPIAVSGMSLVYSAGGVIWTKTLVRDSAAGLLFSPPDPNTIYSSPVFLTDGGVVFTSRRGRTLSLCLWQPTLLEPAALAELEDAPARNLKEPWNELLPDLLNAFSVDPGSGDVFYGTADGLYAITPRPGAVPRQVLAIRGGRIFDPRWSPAGKYLAYTVVFPDGHSQVMMRDRQGGRETKVSATDRRGFRPRWSPDGSYLLWNELVASSVLGYYGLLVHCYQPASGHCSPVFLTGHDSLMVGDKLLQDGRLKEAGRRYREYMGDDPANLGDDRLLEWAKRLDRAKMYEEAVNLYEEHIQSGFGGPGSGPYVMMRLARLSIELEDLEAACGYYLSVLERPMPRSALAMAMEQAFKALGEDEFGLLVEAFLKEPAGEAIDLTRLWKTAYLLRINGQTGEAVRRILSAGDRTSDPMTKLKLAGNIISLGAAGKRRKILKLLTEHSRDSSGESTVALLALANLHLEAGRTAVAIDEFEQALELLNYPPPVVLAVVVVCRRLGETARALDFIERASGTAAGEEDSIYKLGLNRARLCLAIGRDEEAQQHFSALIEKYPKRLEAFLELVDHYLDRSRPDRALSVLAETPPGLCSRPSVAIRTIKALTALERFDEAGAMLRRLLPRLDSRSREKMQSLMEFLDSQTTGQ